MYPCESFARYALPKFRLFVAKELIKKYNFTQTEAAKKLGITQAAISQYLHSKRGHKWVREFEDALPKIQTTTNEIAKGIATGKMSENEVSEKFCGLCLLLREEGKIS